jgi:3-oxoacyl-[acyl-carrier protein] reductase
MENSQKALIIGGNGTLGSAISKKLKSIGYEIAITFHKNKPETNTPNFYLNLEDNSDLIKNSLNQIKQDWGIPDLLIIASGTAFYNSLNNSSQEDINHTYRVDLTAPVEVVQFFLGDFLDRKSGTIHIVSAIAGVIPAMKNMSIYTSAKFGLVGFVRSLAWELLGTGVKISVSCPSGIHSKLPEHALGDSTTLQNFFKQYEKTFDSPDTVAESIINSLNNKEVLFFPTESAKKLFEQNISKPFWR